MSLCRVSIIGLGLIGGSLGLALRQAVGARVEVVGFARRSETAAKAVSLGVVDRAATNLPEAVAGAGAVIIATPVMAERAIMQAIADQVPPGSIVSDVGSTKALVMQWARECLPPTVRFVGGHPMTGKETAGLDQAEAGLFLNRIYCLTPAPDAGREASESMVNLVESLGARPLFVDAETHDALVAGVSHLPIVVSSALVATLAQSPLWPQMSELAATGYRDSTRLASGSPELNRDICLTNQANIGDWIDRYIEELRKYRQLVVNGGDDLETHLRDARQVRERWLEDQGHRFNNAGDARGAKGS